MIKKIYILGTNIEEKSILIKKLHLFFNKLKIDNKVINCDKNSKLLKIKNNSTKIYICNDYSKVIYNYNSILFLLQESNKSILDFFKKLKLKFLYFIVNCRYKKIINTNNKSIDEIFMLVMDYISKVIKEDKI